MSESILSRILQTKRKEVRALEQSTSLEELREAASRAPRPRNFFRAVTRRGRRKLNLIAEVKKASPSAGVIREDFDPVDIARQYAAAGADAVSVLTDREYFQGDLSFIGKVRAAVDLPVLRKDFLIDPLQIYQSRAAGADAILLIAAALPPGKLLDLMILTTELRMTALVEVHGAEELMRVRSMVGFPHAAYSLLGINNRDLATFHVDIATTIRLMGLAGEGAQVVSESGIHTSQDIDRLAAAGVKAVLVGESLMRADDIGRQIGALFGE